MIEFIFIGVIILSIFAYWDYKYAILPNLPVLISIIGYGLLLAIVPTLFITYAIFILLGGGLWLFYAKNHHMSLADSVLFGLFGFCSIFFDMYPVIIFIFLVAFFHKTSICCHYEKKQKLVKMIPPMFISLHLGFAIYCILILF